MVDASALWSAVEEGGGVLKVVSGGLKKCLFLNVTLSTAVFFLFH